EALARRATERLQALQREADRLALEERTLLGDLRKLEIERQLRAEQLKQVDADAARVQAELDATAARIESLAAAERREQPELRARLIEIYKLGQARYLRLLLSTPDLRRLGQSTRTVAALAKLDRDRVDSHAHTIGELEATRKTLEQRRGELEALRAAAEKADVAARRAAQARSAAPNGIEIAAVEGAQALAVHDGVVAFAGTFAGFGNLVILDHGSQTFTLYGDLLEITVKKGARAEHGQPVGTVGPIPSGSDGLYFELRVDGQPVD